MKNVNRIVRPNGEVHFYLRKAGLPGVRFPAEPTEDQVRALIAQLTPAKARPGTLKAALDDYELNDRDFRANAESTRREYGYIIKELDQDFGHLALATFTPAFCRQLMDVWAKRGHRCANLRRQVLKNVLDRCLAPGVMETNPLLAVKNARRPRELAEPHVIWPMAVVEAVVARALEEAKPGLARGVLVGRYVGARRQDIVAIGRGARHGGRFAFLSGKKRVPVDIREDPELTAWLARIPDVPTPGKRAGRKTAQGAMNLRPFTLCFNVMGAPYSEDGFAQELAKIVTGLHKEGAIAGDAYDAHGLRHTRGVELALGGCTDAEGAAQLGHASPASFAQYRRQADRIRLADNAADKVAELRRREQPAGSEILPKMKDAEQ